MSEEYGPNFVTLTDEEGNDIELEYIDALEHNGTTYMAFFPVVEEGEEENEDEYGLIILKSETVDGEEMLANVVDDDDLGGEDLDGFVRAVVVHIGVDGALDAAARLESLEVLDEQARFKGVGMVVVDLGALLVGLAVLPLIVAAVSDDGDGVAEMLLEMARERGLAGAGAAGDADENGAHRRDILPRCSLVCLYYKKRSGKLQGRSTVGEKNSSKKGKNG